jgi:hypothetical protein
MIGGILDKVTGFLDQRMVVTSLLPSAAFWAAVAALDGTQIGWTRVRHWWEHLGTSSVVLLAVVAVAVLVLFALVLSAHEGALLRLYEGYWGRGPGGQLARLAARRHAGRINKRNRDIDRLEDEINDPRVGNQPLQMTKTRQANALYEYLYRNYPSAQKAMPTRLGNILKAAELYSSDARRYKMDAVFFWPRLIAVVPATARADLSDARASLALLLNVCTLALLLTVGTLAAMAAAAVHPASAFWAAAASGFLLATLTYRSALSSARSYGELVRATFDLYRGDLLTQLKFGLPSSLGEERELWANLAQQMYRGAASNPQVLDAARERAASLEAPGSADGWSLSPRKQRRVDRCQRCSMIEVLTRLATVIAHRGCLPASHADPVCLPRHRTG